MSAQTTQDRTHVKSRWDDAEAAGLDPAALGDTGLRDALLKGLRAEGIEAGMWEAQPQPRQTVFEQQVGHPWSRVDDGADSERIAANYAAEYPVTKRLLDTSVVLFSQGSSTSQSR